MSFSTIVLTGAQTAAPHGGPIKKTLAPHELILFDLGVIFNGYCSDITRTVAFHSVSEEQEKIYHTVLGLSKSRLTPVKLERQLANWIRQPDSIFNKQDMATSFPIELDMDLVLMYMNILLSMVKTPYQFKQECVLP